MIKDNSFMVNFQSLSAGDIIIVEDGRVFLIVYVEGENPYCLLDLYTNTISNNHKFLNINRLKDHFYQDCVKNESGLITNTTYIPKRYTKIARIYKEGEYIINM